jgi:hypothetical protein
MNICAILLGLTHFQNLDKYFRNTLYRPSLHLICFNLVIRQHQPLQLENLEVKVRRRQNCYNFHTFSNFTFSLVFIIVHMK